MKNLTYSIAKFENLNIITSLFRDTISTVNTTDYSPQEIEAWAKGADVKENWIRRIETHYFLLSMHENILVGMASIDINGYLDVMYVHHKYQGMGIASELLSKMITYAIQQNHKEITSDVSITAKPFFLHKGFEVVAPQLVQCRGVVLRNYHVKLDIK